MSESYNKNGLATFVTKYSYIWLFILLEAISAMLLVRFNTYQGSVWFSASNGAVATIDKCQSDITSFIDLRNVNRRLTDQNIALQQETEQLRQALRKATKDTTASEKIILQELKGYNLLPATVVSNSASRANNYIVIDRGARDGVRPEMGVIGGGGVVGIVYLTGPNYSLVMPVTNRKSSISCRVRGQNFFGYLQWDGKSLLSAYVDDIPRHAKVKPKEVIETSGYSAVFPPGIFVGRVNKVSNSSDGQSYRLDITLGTDFATLRDVSVVTTPYKAEIDTLRVHAQQIDENTTPAK